MTQLFFDIGSLANYFIADKHKATPARPVQESKDDFRSCLKTLSIIGDQVAANGVQNPEDTPLDKLAPIRDSRAIVSSSDLDSLPICASMFNAIDQMNPELPLMPNIFRGNSAPTVEMQASRMSVKVLTELIKANPPLATLDISNVEIFAEKQQPNRVANQNQAQAAGTQAGPESLFAGRVNSGIRQSNAPDFALAAILNDAAGSNSLMQIIFAADQLFLPDQQQTRVGTIDNQYNSAEIMVPAETLKDLVCEYPAKIMIEAKIPQFMKSNFPESSGNFAAHKNNSAVDGLNYNNAGVKSAISQTAIFDLRPLLTGYSSDIVHIVIKSAVDGNQSNYQPNTMSMPTKLDQSPNNQMESHRIELNNGDAGLPNMNQHLAPGNKITMAARLAANKNDNVANSAPPQPKPESSAHNRPAEKDATTAPEATDKSPAPEKAANQSVKAAVDVKPVDVKAEDIARFDNQLKARPINVSSKAGEQGLARTADNNMITQADKIVDQLRSRFLITPLNSQLTIKLKPESLGRIKIDFKFEGDKIEALFRVQNPDVKNILEAEMPRLRHEWKIDSYKIEMDSDKPGNNSSTMHNRNGNARAYGNRQLAGYRNTGFPGKNMTNKISDIATGNAGGYRIGKINLLI